MPQFIVKAKRLNRRTVVPEFLPDPNNIVGFVNENFTFEGEEVTDVPNPALGKWYRDKVGHFYWGGAIMEVSGVRFVSPAIARSPDLSLVTGQVNYQKLLPIIPAEWMQTNGRNIKVAVLDTGFFLAHPDLDHLKTTAIVQDLGGNNNTTDKEGHGTHIVGLLGAKSTAANGIIGLIPQTKFFLYKVIRDDVGFIDLFAQAAILDAIEKKVDIISMSFNVPSKEESSLHNAIKMALKNNIIIVASAGENDNLIQESLVYPAQFEGVVSVGEVSADFARSVQVPFNNQLDLILPFVDQKSCWINDSFGLYRNLKGSSMATALVTGVLASAMSFKNKAGNPLDDLKNILPTFVSNIFNDPTLNIVKP
ncbi:MAG: S8 family serine peptidase [Ferruginibacter sp.]